MFAHHSAVTQLEKAMSGAGEEGGDLWSVDLAVLDRNEAFPQAAIQALDDFGLPSYYVPARSGGRLSDHSELLELLRAVARRDLTVAVAHAKTFLGGASVWTAGHDAQAEELGRLIQNGAVVSWGLTERHHGSDLLAGELTASRSGDGWVLNGEKWLINNATRGQFSCVLARTEQSGGPRGFSLFLVDKGQLSAESYTCLPKVRTHGIRGADISGIAFHGAPVPDTALVGEPGTGVETVLKTLQLTRTISVSLSLGAADHAVRLATGFVEKRSLYGRRLADLPRVRRILGDVAAMVLLAEAVAVIACRSIHALPGEMSVISAVTKACVPTLVQEVLAQLTELMGARGFLSEWYADGQYAKLERDHRIVAIFDGSTVVNRNALIDQMPRLARLYRQSRWDETGVALVTRGRAELPPFDYTRLTLFSGSGCSLVQSLPDTLGRMTELVSRGLLPPQVETMATQLGRAADSLHEEFVKMRRTARDVPPAAFHLAESYELVYAGAACLWLWLESSQQAAGDTATPAPAPGSEWLQACLASVLTRLGIPCDVSTTAYDRLAEQLIQGRSAGHFSLFSTDMDGSTS